MRTSLDGRTYAVYSTYYPKHSYGAFQPSRHSYGEAEEASAPAPEEEAASSAQTQEIIKGISTFLFGEEAREEEQVIVARIQNHQLLAQKTVGPIRTYHLNEINKLQAKLQAVREQASEARYAAQTSAVTRTGVALISVLGVAAVGFGTLYLGARAWKAIKEA